MVQFTCISDVDAIPSFYFIWITIFFQTIYSTNTSFLFVYRSDDQTTERTSSPSWGVSRTNRQGMSIFFSFFIFDFDKKLDCFLVSFQRASKSNSSYTETSLNDFLYISLFFEKLYFSIDLADRNQAINWESLINKEDMQPEILLDCPYCSC